MNKSQILKLLQAQLEQLKFIDGISRDKEFDKQVLKKIADSFNEKVVSEEVVAQAAGESAFKAVLDKAEEGETEGEKRLAEFSKVDAKEIAKDIYDFLLELPKIYYFDFKMPSSDVAIEPFKLTDDIELFSFRKEEKEKTPGKESALRNARNLFFGKNPSYKEGDVIMRITRHGYVGEYGMNKINGIDPLYIWKVSLGVYLALRAITLKKNTQYFLGVQEYKYFVSDASTNEIIKDVSESTDDQSYLSGLEFSPTIFNLTNFEKTVGKKTTRFEDINEIIGKLFSIATTKEGKKNSQIIKHQRMINNGSFWFYEALKTLQTHTKVIYMTTSFDSLLPSNVEEKSLKAELIANVVAQNSLEASQMREDVIKLYTLRNDIVHGKKATYQLESDEERSSTNVTISKGLSILIKFLSNRIHFISGGINKK